MELDYIDSAAPITALQALQDEERVERSSSQTCYHIYLSPSCLVVIVSIYVSFAYIILKQLLAPQRGVHSIGAFRDPIPSHPIRL